MNFFKSSRSTLPLSSFGLTKGSHKNESDPSIKSKDDNVLKQRGAVFFYILLAIVLLAALSYAVSRGGRTSTSTLTDQQAKLAAQEIIEHGQTVANAVQKLRLRGCSDTEISFENDVVSGYANSTSPTDKSCHVFDVAGGSISYKEVNNISLDSSFNAAITYQEWYTIGNLRIVDLASSNADLLTLVPYLKQEVCSHINRILGLPINTPSDTYSGGLLRFNGEATDYDLTANPDIGDEVTEVAGKTSFCVRHGGTFYYYVQALIAR